MCKRRPFHAQNQNAKTSGQGLSRRQLRQALRRRRELRYQRLGAQPARHDPRLRRRERRPEHRRRVLRRRLLGLHLREPPRLGQPTRRRGGRQDRLHRRQGPESPRPQLPGRVALPGPGVPGARRARDGHHRRLRLRSREDAGRRADAAGEEPLQRYVLPRRLRQDQGVAFRQAPPRRVRWRIRPLWLRQGVGPRPRQACGRPGTRRCCARHLRCAHRRHERRRHSRHAQ